MSDCIGRQQAIDALKICDNNEDGINCYKCPLRDERWDGAWQDDETSCYRKLMRDSAELLSAQPNLQPTCNQLAIDTISRQAAIDVLNVGVELLRRVLDDADVVGVERAKYEWGLNLIESYIADVNELPSAHPEPHYDEWCTGCKEYDQKRHNCPRWNKVIRQTLKDIKPQKGHWERVSASAYRTSASYIYRCDNCGEDNWNDSNFCPNCGRLMVNIYKRN